MATGGTFQRIVSKHLSGRVSVARDVRCRACNLRMGVVKDGKLILRVPNRAVVVKATGVVETTCERCKGPVRLPLSLTPPPKGT